jgi:hypothetical protein
MYYITYSEFVKNRLLVPHITIQFTTANGIEATRFVNEINAWAVFVNASTCFNNGG